ncbi:MAG: N-glycosylase/DNA lyase [Candidatus Woesearchaeota archaeon]
MTKKIIKKNKKNIKQSNKATEKIKNLLLEYESKKDKIRKRLDDFIKFYNEDYSWFYENNELILKKINKNNDERIFEELCFCILTANGSALTGIKAIQYSRDILINGTKEEIQKKLKESGVRFHNRAEYIFHNREKLKKDYNFEIKKLIDEKKHNKQELREFFVSYIKGFSYKEASHFLRNIGVFDYAILDKHILRTMLEYKIIREIPKTITKKKYLELEQKFIDFSKFLNIDMNELDLLLWQTKTGKILK